MAKSSAFLPVPSSGVPAREPSGGGAGAHSEVRWPFSGWHGTERFGGRLLTMLAASVLVHLVLTPFPAMFGLLQLLPKLSVNEPADTIEIELTELPLAQSTASPARPSEVQPTVSAPEPPQSPIEPDAVLAKPPPAPATPKASEPQPEVKVVPPVVEQLAAPSELYSDPIALAGNAAQIADSNANVRLFIFADVVRQQPLGNRIGSLLKRTPQWRDFFGPADIDPIRDVDRVLIAGPQLRNSSQIVAVVQHHLKRAAINAALSQLVSRKGEWIDKEARMARAEADRASRIFSAPNDSVVIVAPPQMEKQLRSLGDTATFPPSSGDIAVSAYIVTPYRVAQGTQIDFPKSVKWVRLDLRPTSDGGGILKILAQDTDKESAKENAALFQMLIDQVAAIDLSRGGGLGALASMLLGSQKVKMLKEASFHSKGARIEGTIVATQTQLMNLADLLDAFLPPDSSATSTVPSVSSARTQDAPVDTAAAFDTTAALDTTAADNGTGADGAVETKPVELPSAPIPEPPPAKTSTPKDEVPSVKPESADDRE